MTMTSAQRELGHSHVFLGDQHEASERRTWAVIWLCGAMMVVEIIGGLLFGSIALVADGLHMSTHAGALLLAALAYRYARKYANDARFSFGTGKLGDLAGFTSAIVLLMIALLIGYEAIARLLNPVSIRFGEAIPIAVIGLMVNIASAWLLIRSGHHHGHDHGHDHEHHDEVPILATASGVVALSIFEDGVPPRFRLQWTEGVSPEPGEVSLVTVRDDGSRQTFLFRDRGPFLESLDEVPEPHAFTATLAMRADAAGTVLFTEHEHAGADHARDNNMRAAIVHVIADAAVSVLVIIGLVLARLFGWVWMDPLAGIIGACVIASWSYGLIRDTGAILLDMNPDQRMAMQIRHRIEASGDTLGDLHLWRLGPGHLGAIISVFTASTRDERYYRALLSPFHAVSHLTIEVRSARA